MLRTSARPWVSGAGGSALIVALSVGALSSWYRPIDPDDPRWATFDLHRYEAMRAAVPGFAAVRQPEAFRLAGPFLASLTSFRLVTLTALGAAAVLLFRWLRAERVAQRTALLGLVFLGLTKLVVGEVVWDAYQAGDALGFVALMGALVAVQQRRWPAFAASLALGVIARETPLLAVAPAVVIDRRALAWSVPAAIVFILMRVFVPHADGVSLFEAFARFAPGHVTPTGVVHVLVAFSPTAVVVLAAPRRVRLRGDHVALVIGTLVSSLFGENVERLLLPMAPVVALAVARVIEPWPRWALGSLLASAFLGGLHHETTRAHLEGRTTTLLVTGVVTCAAFVLALVNRQGSQISRLSGGPSDGSSPVEEP